MYFWTQLNSFKYCYLILMIIFHINDLFEQLQLFNIVRIRVANLDFRDSLFKRYVLPVENCKAVMRIIAPDFICYKSSMICQSPLQVPPATDWQIYKSDVWFSWRLIRFNNPRNIEYFYVMQNIYIQQRVFKQLETIILGKRLNLLDPFDQ